MEKPSSRHLNVPDDLMERLIVPELETETVVYKHVDSGNLVVECRVPPLSMHEDIDYRACMSLHEDGSIHPSDRSFMEASLFSKLYVVVGTHKELFPEHWSN